MTYEEEFLNKLKEIEQNVLKKHNAKEIKPKATKAKVIKDKKAKIKDNKCTKCGEEITHTYKRKICKECLRKENYNRYQANKDKYYEARKVNRKVKTKIVFCKVCNIEFETTHGNKCTCSDECRKNHYNQIMRDRYKRIKLQKVTQNKNI